MKYRLVPEDELIDLIKDQIVLAALDQDGVDNWGRYSESLWNLAEGLNEEKYFFKKDEFVYASDIFNAYAEKETEKYESVSAEEYENGLASILSMKIQKT